MAEEGKDRKCTFQWKINNFLERITEMNLRSNYFKIEKYKYYLDLGYTDRKYEKMLVIYLNSVSNEPISYKAVCKICLIDRRGVEIQVAKRRTAFQNGDYAYVPLMSILHQELFCQKEDLLPNGALTFRLSWNAEADCDLLEQGTQTILDSKSEDFIKLWGKLSEDFGGLYESKKDTDSVLRVGDEQFPVHRAVLSARSSVFAAMFHHDTSESRSGDVDIQDVDAAVLSDVLYYMYSGKIRGLTADTAVRMYAVADKYALIEMRDLCLNFLMLNLTTENVTGTAILAHVHGESALESKVIQFIEVNSKELLENNSWKEFSKTNPSLAVNYLHRSLIALSDKTKN